MKKNHFKIGDNINISAHQKIYEALILGIKNFFAKLNFKKAIIGLSGGIDSALVAVLACDALGKENVKVVYLPTEFSSEESFKDVKKIAENLNINLDIINIDSVFKNILALTKPYFQNKPFDTTEENIQSRIRGLVLMAFSNKFGYILLNTSNKSELVTGYGTLYGDMCGALSVIGDLYKTQVYSLSEFINKEKEIIPRNIITKEPTAELKFGQKDSDSLPKYEILDNILLHYLEYNNSDKEISEKLNYDISLVSKVISMINKNEFKRFQAPPVLRISYNFSILAGKLLLIG